MAIKSLSIRIDEELLHKLHIAADCEGRSANSEILILIRDAVKAYEAAAADGTGWRKGAWILPQKPSAVFGQVTYPYKCGWLKKQAA